MKEINISPRLLSAADFVRQDAILADIGTDHAYLPLFLLSEGRIKKAFCSDVNEGPLASARANADAAGLLDRVEFTLADGADALSGRGITDYAICGMGGELISDIVSRIGIAHSASLNSKKSGLLFYSLCVFVSRERIDLDVKFFCDVNSLLADRACRAQNDHSWFFICHFNFP